MVFPYYSPSGLLSTLYPIQYRSEVGTSGRPLPPKDEISWGAFAATSSVLQIVCDSHECSLCGVILAAAIPCLRIPRHRGQRSTVMTGSFPFDRGSCCGSG